MALCLFGAMTQQCIEVIAGFMQWLLWCVLTVVHRCGAAFGLVNK